MRATAVQIRLASFSLWRLLFNLLFWSALFTFILGVRYYDIGNIAFINLPVQIPTQRIFLNGITLGLCVGVFYTLVEHRLESLRLYDNSLGGVILLRTLYLFVVCGLTLAAVSYLNYYLDVAKGNVDAGKVGYSRYLFSATVQFLFLGAFIGNFALSVFHTLRTKIVIRVSFSPDGKPVDFELIESDGPTQTAIDKLYETARRAVNRANSDGGLPLPEGKYDTWRVLDLVFDANGMALR